MKTLLTILIHSIFFVHFAAESATAQITYQNSLGVNTQHEYPSWCIYGPSMTVYTVNIVLVNPVNPDFDGTGASTPVTNVGGFECRFRGQGDIDILDVRYPVNAINAGTDEDEFIVGFGEPVPVIDGVAILAHVDVFLWPRGTNPQVEYPGDKASPQPCENFNAALLMSPLRVTPSIAGSMVYHDADDPHEPLVAAENYLNWPDEGVEFVLESLTVETDDHTWGTMKALYR